MIISKLCLAFAAWKRPEEVTGSYSLPQNAVPIEGRYLCQPAGSWPGRTRDSTAAVAVGHPQVPTMRRFMPSMLEQQ
jgi:hypothetical protein